MPNLEAARPYIGVTGIKRPLDTSAVVNIFKDSEISTIGYWGMIGYLFSQHKLKSDAELTKLAESISGSSTDVTRSFLHYFSPDEDNVKREVEQTIRGLQKINGRIFDGLQVNVPWIDPRIVEDLRLRYGLLLTLQVGPRIIHGSSKSKEIRRRLFDYNGIVDYILVDASGGRGESINFHDACRFSDLIDEAFYNSNFKPIKLFAGGFSSKNVSYNVMSLHNLIGEKFGIDAQKKLKNINGNLDTGQLLNYVNSAVEILEEL